MKKYVLMSAVLLLVSCSSESDIPRNDIADDNCEEINFAVPVSPASTEFTEEELRSSILLFDYIDTLNGEYCLTIDKDEAVAIGVAPNIYDRAVHDMKVGNQMMKECRQECDYFELSLPNSSAEILENMNKESVTNSAKVSDNKISDNRYKKQYGSIQTFNQDPGYGGFVVEDLKVAVEFQYRSSVAPFPYFYCTVDCFGVVRGGSKAASLYDIAVVTVPLSASGGGTSARLSFRTTDSHGGGCAWYALPQR